ncbi:hypothetical protein, partial [Ureaplasma urealyticum]|uniref:hypothetical protein n=1 Tax=Ureaplasma urealyticum TaxID=2130 RepID=UPI00016C296E
KKKKKTNKNYKIKLQVLSERHLQSSYVFVKIKIPIKNNMRLNKILMLLLSIHSKEKYICKTINRHKKQ